MIIYYRIEASLMEKVKITFGNQTIEVDKNTSYLDISRQTKWKDIALAVKKNNELFPLSAKASTDEVIEFIDASSIEGAKMYKAAVKFILEVALKTVFKGSEIEYLHSVPGGMLGEIKYEKVLNLTLVFLQKIIKTDFLLKQ